MNDLYEGIGVVLFEYPLYWVIPATFFVLYKYNENTIREYVLNKNYLFSALFVVILIGFLTNMDNDQQYGCIIDRQPIFAPQNILYTTISLLLALSATLIQNTNYRLLFLSIELLYWLYKLYYINKVNVVGFVGVSVPNVSVFEFFALAIRLQLINLLMNLNKSLKFVFGISAVLIILKIVIDLSGIFKVTTDF
ncbi:MAG: hypothetical protein F9K23_16535 [Bacteroidetes bacterium]|nr:MAG: hypothetical protein F9K23_16535 [Bacteroidota bacterium]